MRTSSLLLALVLAGCGREEAAPTAPVNLATGQEIPAAEHIPCARGDAALARDCTVERQSDEGGVILTIRHPDGAFRRLRVAADGSRVVAADGAEPATVAQVDGAIEVAIAGERYRLPAAGAAPTP